MSDMAFPLRPPREWFDSPEPDVPTPLTFEKSGRVYGHLALWGSCHTGFLNGALKECVQPPKSPSGYKHFHLGVLETDGGDVPVGKITYNTGHAPLSASLPVAAAHYDHSGSVGAFVQARDGKLGIWASGAVKSDLTPEGFRDLRANGPSGDWRGSGHGLEMIAALAVPVQGFPVPRAQLALSASADVEAMILPAWMLEDEEEFALVASADYQERKKALSATIAQIEVRDRGFLRRRRALSDSRS
jgi:hypothetical protein